MPKIYITYHDIHSNLPSTFLFFTSLTTLENSIFCNLIQIQIPQSLNNPLTSIISSKGGKLPQPAASSQPFSQLADKSTETTTQSRTPLLALQILCPVNDRCRHGDEIITANDESFNIISSSAYLIRIHDFLL